MLGAMVAVRCPQEFADIILRGAAYGSLAAAAGWLSVAALGP